MSRFALAALLLPMTVLAQVASDASSVLQSLPLDQLCEQPRSQEVLAEFKRREIFSKRELRSLEMNEVQTRISEAALLCIRPLPDQVFHPDESVVDRLGIEAAYLYSTAGPERLLVYVKHSLGELRVSAVNPLPIGAGIPDMLRPNFTFRSAVPRSCLSNGPPGTPNSCYDSPNRSAGTLFNSATSSEGNF